MKVKMLDKVKDSHNILVDTEKGAVVQPSVKLFEKGEIVESNDSDIPEGRLTKLISYGFAKAV